MSNQDTNHDLSPEAFTLFMNYAQDAGNWSGTPCVGGNVQHGPKENGYLTDLKKKGLLWTEADGAESFITFSDSGMALAAANGVTLYD